MSSKLSKMDVGKSGRQPNKKRDPHPLIWCFLKSLGDLSVVTQETDIPKVPSTCLSPSFYTIMLSVSRLDLSLETEKMSAGPCAVLEQEGARQK